MVLEYLKGKTIAKLAAESPDAEEVARIGRETCAAPGTMAGTPPYMAPEQWLGQPVTPAIDIWATGCILYELLSGRRARDYSQVDELIAAAHRRERVPPLRAATRPVPAWLADAVMAMLEPDPRNRPTAAECQRLLSGPPAASWPVTVVSDPQPPTSLRPESPPVRPVPPAQPPASAPGTWSLPHRSQPTRTPVHVPSGGSAGRGRPAPGRAVPARRRARPAAVLAVAIALAGAGSVTAWLATRSGPSWVPGTGTAYVTSASGIVPVNLTTGQAGTPIRVTGTAYGIAIGAQGDTAYVEDVTACRDCAGTVGVGSLLPVNLTTGAAGRAATIARGGSGNGLFSFVLSNNGATAYATSEAGVVPVDLATGRTGTVVKVGGASSLLALSPGGDTLFVTTGNGRQIVPVDLRDGAVGNPVNVPGTVLAMAMTPGAASLYVYDAGGFAALSPVTGRVTWQVRSPELGDGGATGGSLVITPGAQTAYAGGAGTGVVPINLGTHQAGPLINVGAAISSMALSPDGKILYASGLNGSLYPVTVPAGQVGKPVSVGPGSQSVTTSP